ncbi:MAG: 30S ribosomal protein S4 [Thermoplasmata archaeon]|nr:30S ribosomal protein S4 [Thermoplasmata archaeon]
MGDPKFSRRKYDTPSHPWRAERIKTETELQKRYGLKNKRELWKAQSMVRTFRSRSRDLQARLRTGEKQAEIETKQLLEKCGRLGLLPAEGTTLNDVLSITLENILSRRFQTMVYQMGLAYTQEQARQFITHGHIAIKGRIVTIPGYIVRRVEENVISYAPTSPISNELHPIRPKPKDALDIEKEKALVEQKEKQEEKPKPKKEPAEGKHPKAAKPSLEKLLKKDGAEIKAEPENLPEIEDVEEEPEKKPEKKKADAKIEKKGEHKKDSDKEKQPKKKKDKEG